MTVTSPLTVRILGSGNAAKKHRDAFAALGHLYRVIDDGQADIIDVCTPPFLHFQQAKDALMSGSHALVEKPVCGSLAECDALIELERQTGKRVYPIFQYRFSNHDPVDRIIHLGFRRDEPYFSGWRGDWRLAFGGAMTSHGIHALDLLIQKHSMPFATQAIAVHDWSRPERAMVAHLFWRETAGFVAVKLGSNKTKDGFYLGNPHFGYVAMLWALAEQVNNGLTPTISLHEARQSIELLTAIYYSAHARIQATLPIGPDHPFYRGWSKSFAQHQSPPDTQSESCR